MAEQIADTALAAWESSTVQNLGPLISEADEALVWDAILAHREHRNPGTVASALRAAVRTRGAPAQDVVERAIDRVPLKAKAVPSTSADAAQE